MGNTEFRAFFWTEVKSEFNILRSNKTKLFISTSKLCIQRTSYVFDNFFLKQSSQMSRDHRYDITEIEEKYTLPITSHLMSGIGSLQYFQCCSHQVMVKLLILCNPWLTSCSVNLIFFFPQRLELNEWRISEMKNYTSVHYYPIRKPDQINQFEPVHTGSISLSDCRELGISNRSHAERELKVQVQKCIQRLKVDGHLWKQTVE